MRQAKLLLAGILALGVVSSGCATPRAARRTPERVLKMYVQALKTGQFDRAYDLTSLSFRKRHSRTAFKRLLRENKSGLKHSIGQLKGGPVQTKIQAEVKYGSNETLHLEVEKGRWKIASDPTDFYSQKTPEDALRSFIRAIERKRYNIVLRFVPARWADAMTVGKLKKQWEGGKQKEVTALLKALKENLKAPIHRSGDRATMPYGEKSEVSFVLEEGVWKIEDPD